MMKIYFFVLVLLFIGANSFGQSDFMPVDNTQLLKEQFKNNGATLKSLKSNFIQEKYMAYLSTTVVSKGGLWFKKQDKIRWEYNEPFKYLVLVKGNVVTVKDENNTSVFNKNPNKTFQELNKVLAGSVNGSLIDNPDFKFEVAKNQNYYRVILEPLNEQTKAVFSSIEILFAKSNMAIYQLKMNEQSGDKITITFNNLTVNIPISDSVFEL